MQRSGFSLTELLLVLAILGVVLATGYVSLNPLVKRSRIGEAAAAVAGSLQRARSYAQRSNLAASWVRTGTATYRLTLGTETIDAKLPAGLSFVQPPVGSGVSYSAPYGEIDAVPHRITIRGNGFEADVRIVGVTGKVIRSSVRKAP